MEHVLTEPAQHVGGFSIRWPNGLVAFYGLKLYRKHFKYQETWLLVEHWAVLI